MHILMFGWEFPPFNSGGLGVACQGITEGLIQNGHNVYLVLPKVSPFMQSFNSDKFKILAAHQSGGVVHGLTVPSGLYSPYATANGYIEFIEDLKDAPPEHMYGQDLFKEVYRYASQAAIFAKKMHHDVIHTHDWLTAEAGIQAKKISGKPHLMHVHATDFDRTGGNPNQQVYDIERRGMHKADRIIAVSEYTKKMLIKHYGVPEYKIDVVHNAVKSDFSRFQSTHHLNKTDKIVLFLGRMTIQKGPDYFLRMAAKVLEKKTRVKFIMAGDGDMMNQVIQMAADLGIARNVLFAGFLQGDEVARAYSSADLYVMPSVSEPFGIAPLEAIKSGTPVLISKQAGVSEVIKNALRCDFWDVNEMASKVLAVLQYPELYNTLKEHGRREVDRMDWRAQAEKIEKSYLKALAI
jgi:glycosyltransferase involved in cell wall biosynthesis